jgi:hypothetical protein
VPVFAGRARRRARARHAKLHAAWERDGRPKEFDVSVELAVDGVIDAEVEKQRSQIEMIKRLFGDKR